MLIGTFLFSHTFLYNFEISTVASLVWAPCRPTDMDQDGLSLEFHEVHSFIQDERQYAQSHSAIIKTDLSAGTNKYSSPQIQNRTTNPENLCFGAKLERPLKGVKISRKMEHDNTLAPYS